MEKKRIGFVRPLIAIIAISAPVVAIHVIGLGLIVATIWAVAGDLFSTVFGWVGMITDTSASAG